MHDTHKLLQQLGSQIEKTKEVQRACSRKDLEIADLRLEIANRHRTPSANLIRDLLQAVRVTGSRAVFRHPTSLVSFICRELSKHYSLRAKTERDAQSAKRKFRAVLSRHGITPKHGDIGSMIEAVDCALESLKD